jgi:hypothetical protein
MPTAEETFFYRHPSVFTCKSHDLNAHLRNGANKRLNFFFFNCQWRNKDHFTLVICGGVELFQVRNKV